MKGCTYLPGYFLASLYLDSRYEAITKDGESSTQIAPDIHVTYLISSYPDYSDGGLYVTNIEITDPTIHVYGLTITSSDEEITNTMESLGFLEETENRWNKNNCVFSFHDSGIIIGAAVTNKNGIVF